MLPTIEIAAVAPDIGHDVDRRRAAQYFAAHGLDNAVDGMRFRLAAVTPIVPPLLVHLADADGNMDQWVIVLGTGFLERNT